MKKGLKITLIVVGIIILLIMPIIGGYNKIIGLEQNVLNSKANIETNLQRRSDLIPNLVSTVKGYASQEKDIFTDIANARAKLGGAKTMNEKANADAQLSSSLSRLLLVVERYPDLKSNENFKDLTIALEGTENRINIARQDYNTAVGTYNTTIKRFPNSIISSICGFQQKEYYKALESAKEVPKVDFGK